MRTLVAIAGIIATAGTIGCGPSARLNLVRQTGGNAALYRQFQAYDGHTGRPVPFSDVARRCAQADVVLFGESHNDVVCNQIEAQLLAALAERPRPVALAMEFFETDTQADLDAYLDGRIAETPFVERSRQKSPYYLSHRPLIELCRAGGIPVLAANAPRRLLRAYRESRLDYDAFRAGLDAADQRWLPVSSEIIDGPYYERYVEVMSSHPPATQPTTAPATQPTTAPATQPGTDSASQPTSAPETQPATEPAAHIDSADDDESAPPPSRPDGDGTGELAVDPGTDASSDRPAEGEKAEHAEPATQPTTRAAKAPRLSAMRRGFRLQLLWDDTMAESVANFRRRHPGRRVMLVVGSFHVAHDGGTALKLRQRRPNDRVVSIVYRGTGDGSYPFDEDDRGASDMVIYGMSPPEPTTRPAGGT